MTPNTSGSSDDPGQKKPWGRNPLRPLAYWTLVAVAVGVVVVVVIITVSMGVFV